MFIPTFSHHNKKKSPMPLTTSKKWSRLVTILKTIGVKPLIRKEFRKSYDEYAKYDETSAKTAKANGKKAV